MKKQSAYPIQKKVFAVLASFVIIFCTNLKTYAFTDSNSTAAKLTAVSYQGLKDKLLVFKVDYKNDLSKPALLVIRGDANEILYRKLFEAKPSNTNILLSEVPENCKLTFEILTVEKSLSQSFQIDTNVKTIHEYVVKGV